MDRYTYIHNKIWVDEKFNALDQDSKMLVLYIFTSPHCNMIGYYRLPLLYAAADLGMEPERVKHAFEQVSDAGMVLYDPASSVVLVPNFLKYNRLQNANQAKGACALVEKLPENCLLQAFLGCVSEYAPQLLDAFGSLGNGLVNGLPNGYPNGSPNPSETVTQPVTPYTEYRVQSTENLSSPNGDSSTDVDLSPDGDHGQQAAPETGQPEIDPVREVMDAYNRIFGDLWKKPLELTNDRRAKIKTRLKRYSPGDIIQAMEAIRASPFHCGDNPEGRVYATPEFICRSDGKVDEWMKKATLAITRRGNARWSGAKTGEKSIYDDIELYRPREEEPWNDLDLYKPRPKEAEQ